MIEPLRQMRDVAHRVDPTLFAQSRAGIYLLGLYPSAPDSPVNTPARRTFSTSPAMSVAELMSMVSAAEDPAMAGRFLRQVRKSDRNPFQGHISVGRAANNDVVIVHPSVSKLHAHVLQDPAANPNEPTSLRVIDVGSRNGTWVDDRRMVVDQPTPLVLGSRLRFGDVICTLLDAPALYRTLRSLFPPPS